MSKGRRRWIVVCGLVVLVAALVLLIPGEPTYRFMEEYRARMKRLPMYTFSSPVGLYETRSYRLHVDPDVLLAAMKRDLVADGWSAIDETNTGGEREVGLGHMEWRFSRGDDTIDFHLDDRPSREADTTINFTSRSSWLRQQWLGLRKMLRR